MAANTARHQKAGGFTDETSRSVRCRRSVRNCWSVNSRKQRRQEGLCAHHRCRASRQGLRHEGCHHRPRRRGGCLRRRQGYQRGAPCGAGSCRRGGRFGSGSTRSRITASPKDRFCGPSELPKKLPLSRQKECASTTRIICAPKARKFHTCEARSVFPAGKATG